MVIIFFGGPKSKIKKEILPEGFWGILEVNLYTTYLCGCKIKILGRVVLRSV
jgi:hypothetical protein